MPRPRSARRPRSRAARLALPLAIPMALGLTLGIILGVSGGTQHTKIQQTAVNATAIPDVSSPARPSATAAPTAP